MQWQSVINVTEIYSWLFVLAGESHWSIFSISLLRNICRNNRHIFCSSIYVIFFVNIQYLYRKCKFEILTNSPRILDSPKITLDALWTTERVTNHKQWFNLFISVSEEYYLCSIWRAHIWAPIFVEILDKRAELIVYFIVLQYSV